MIIYRGIQDLLTLSGAKERQARRPKEEDLGIISKAALLVSSKGEIRWVGPESRLTSSLLKSQFKVKQLRSLKEINLDAATVLPGLIECHTHLGFGGNRALEFEMRLQGATYQEIYERGGGIQSTVRATRKASQKELEENVLTRAKQFLRQGVTLLEAKSGYGLDLKTEIRLLQAYQKVLAPQIVSTYLGLHAKPPEHDHLETYVDEVVHKILPQIAKKKLAQRVDVFVEKGYFTPEQAQKYFEAADRLGFEKVIHADQLSLSGGAKVAVQTRCLSADHLIQVQEKEIQELSSSEVTCVLLPAADLYMKCAYPPARRLIDAGARVALATDFNPGSSPTQNVNLVGVLARLEMNMTLPEVIVGYTAAAAWALGREKTHGALQSGMRADFACSQKNWRELFYQVGDLDFNQVILSGRKLNKL